MSELFEEKFAYIDSLFEAARLDGIGLPTGLLTHAVVNTIDLSELTNLFVKHYSHDKLICNNICKRIVEYPDKVTIYDYLIDTLKAASYLDRLRFRKIIDTIIELLDEERQLEYFSYFYRSNYRYEIRAALKMAHYIWNKQIEDLLIKDYYKKGDNDVLIVLIEMISDDHYLNLAKTAFTALPPNYVKGKLIKRLKGYSLSDISFLQETDPGNFLGLVGYTNELITDELILNCYNRVPQKYKPFALWNIGKLGKWELLKPELKKYLLDTEGAFAGFSDIIFE